MRRSRRQSVRGLSFAEDKADTATQRGCLDQASIIGLPKVEFEQHAACLSPNCIAYNTR